MRIDGILGATIGCDGRGRAVLCHEETGTCRAGPAVQTPAFKIAMKG